MAGVWEHFNKELKSKYVWPCRHVIPIPAINVAIELGANHGISIIEWIWLYLGWTSLMGSETWIPCAFHTSYSPSHFPPWTQPCKNMKPSFSFWESYKKERWIQPSDHSWGSAGLDWDPVGFPYYSSTYQWFMDPSVTLGGSWVMSSRVFFKTLLSETRQDYF